METFSALLVICAENSPVPGEFPAQRPVTRSLYVSFICVWTKSCENNRESCVLRRYRAHYDVIVMVIDFVSALLCLITMAKYNNSLTNERLLEPKSVFDVLFNKMNLSWIYHKMFCYNTHHTGYNVWQSKLISWFYVNCLCLKLFYLFCELIIMITSHGRLGVSNQWMTRLFVQQFVRLNNKGTTKSPDYWLFGRTIRWLMLHSLHNGAKCGKHSHGITSSWNVSLSKDVFFPILPSKD